MYTHQSVTSYKRSISEIIVTMLRRKTTCRGQDSSHSTGRSAWGKCLSPGHADSVSLWTGKNTALLGEQCHGKLCPALQPTWQGFLPSAGSPLRPGNQSQRSQNLYSKLAANTKAEEKLQPVQRLDSEELPLIDLDSEQREAPTPLVVLEDASLQSQLLRFN